MNETIVTVAGNLVSDVEEAVTSRGDAMARFRVACTVKRYDRATGTWSDGDTSYWNVTAWRRAAQNAAASLGKGHPVVVSGRIRQRTVDREVPGAGGAKMPVTYTDLEAVSFGLDLSRCRATFQRAPIGPQTADAGVVGAPAASGGVGSPVPESGRAVPGSGAVDPAAA